MNKGFVCLACGSCCRRITVDKSEFGISAGLCLMPEERKLFKSYPGSFVPYIGLQKVGRQKISIVLYQMIIEPCPLLDPDTNLCINYENRPTICRAYPFSIISDGLSVEQRCQYIQTHFSNAEYGKSKILAGADQITGMRKMSVRIQSIANKPLTNKKINCLIFDYKKRQWMGNDNNKFGDTI